MVVGAVVLCRSCRSSGSSTPLLFALIGAANLAVAVAIGRTMPASWLNDFLSIVFRAFFRLEVKGLENIDKAGHNAIIALNHVSFLDAPLAVSILPKRPVFAIDVGDVAALVDPAVPQIRAHHGARSAQAVLAARHHQCGDATAICW